MILLGTQYYPAYFLCTGIGDKGSGGQKLPEPFSRLISPRYAECP